MSRLKADEARRIANDNSIKLQEELDKVFKLIEQIAKEGEFTLHYESEASDTNLIAPLQAKLCEMGYSVTSLSLRDIRLTIGW